MTRYSPPLSGPSTRTGIWTKIQDICEIWTKIKISTRLRVLAAGFLGQVLSELRFEESPRLVPSPHRRALPEGQPFLGLRTCASVRFAQRQLIAASQQHAACVGLRPILGFAQYIGRRPILQSNKLLCNIVLLCPPKGKLPAGQGLAPCRQDVLHAVCGTSAAKLLRLLSRRAKPCGFAARFCGAP